MLFKEYPYNGKTEYQIFKEIESNKLLKEIDDEELNDLVYNKMLKINENERISWDKYLLHLFFQKNFERINLAESNRKYKLHFEPFDLCCINCNKNICEKCKIIIKNINLCYFLTQD